MSDDFDRDDLDWLSDDGDDDSRRNDDDDLSLELDWLRGDDDADDQPARRDDRLGVTGELSWLDEESGSDEGASSRDDQRTGVTGQLSWLDSMSSGAEKSPRDDDERRTGVTGQLSWQGDSRESEFESQLDEAEAAASFDASSFLDADSGDEMDLPEWMQGMDMPDLGEDEDDYEDEYYDEEDLPEDAPAWLSGTGALSEQVQSNEPPSWLPDTGSLYDDDEVEEQDDEAPSWLADTGSLGGIVEDEEDAPSWLADTGSLGGMVEETGDAPSWLSGTGPLDEDVPQQSEPARKDLPDWLMGSDTYEEEESEEFSPQDAGVPEWLSDTGALGATPAKATHDDEDDDKVIPEWLQGQDTFNDESEEFEAVDTSEAVPDWLAGGKPFGDEEEPIGSRQFEDYDDDEEAFEGAVPDWLSAQQAGSDFDFNEFEDEEEPAPIGNVQEFDSLFGEDDFEVQSEEDFLFAELTGDVENVDALLEDTDDDDFDLLGELGVGESTGLTGMLSEMPEDESDTIFGKPDFAMVSDDDLDDLFGEDDVFDEEEVFATEAPRSGTMSDDDLDDLFGADDEDEQEDVFAAEAPRSGMMSDDDLDDLFGMDDGDEYEEEVFATEAPRSGMMSDDDLDSLFGMDDSEEQDDAFSPSEAVPSGVMSEDDLDSLFGDEEGYEEEERFDWFGEEQQAVSETGEPDWLSEVDADDFDAVPNDQSFLAELGIEADDEEEEPQFQNVDDYLSTFGNNRSLALPQTGDLEDLSQSVDFDQLFDDDLEEIDDEQPQRSVVSFDPDSNPERPSWLDDVTVNVGGVSAATMIRGQKDAPIEDLPDRLQALHERGQEMRGKKSEISAELKSVLPDVTDSLPEVDFGVTQSAVVSPLNLTPEQHAQASLLRTLAGGSVSGGVGVSLVDEEQPQRAARRRLLSGRVVERFFILLILALAVILPFVDSLDFLHVGDLPPAQFEAGSPQAAFFGQVDELEAGDLVLVAAEYGPPAAAELDAGLQAIYIHLLAQGARPFVVSGNPVGLLHAGNVLEDIAEDLPVVENQDYFIGRYLVGDAIGVRAFAETITSVVASDSQGRSTGLEVNSMNDFALIIVVSDRSDVVRNWAEQVAPETTTPMLALASYAASPLAQPYMQAASGASDEISGLLVGFRDAYTYLTLLGVPHEGDIVEDVMPEEIPTEAPTEEPSATVPPTSTPTPDETDEALAATEEVTEEVTEVATEEVIYEDEATNTPRATATTAPVTPTSISSPTPLQSPTVGASATPANTPTPAVEMIRFGTVNSTTSINVRSGASTSDGVVAVLRPNDRVLIIGENADTSWYEVLLDDGTPGWVAAFLLTVEVEMVPVTPESNNGKRRVDAVPERLQDDDATPEVTEQATEEADETEEPEIVETEEATPEATEEPATVEDDNTDDDVLTLGFGNIEYRDERWYAMTLGLVVSIVVIFAGTIINVLRALARRRRGE